MPSFRYIRNIWEEERRRRHATVTPFSFVITYFRRFLLHVTILLIFFFFIIDYHYFAARHADITTYYAYAPRQETEFESWETLLQDIFAIVDAIFRLLPAPRHIGLQQPPCHAIAFSFIDYADAIFHYGIHATIWHYDALLINISPCWRHATVEGTFSPLMKPLYFRMSFTPRYADIYCRSIFHYLSPLFGITPLFSPMMSFWLSSLHYFHYCIIIIAFICHTLYCRRLCHANIWWAMIFSRFSLRAHTPLHAIVTHDIDDTPPLFSRWWYFLP